MPANAIGDCPPVAARPRLELLEQLHPIGRVHRRKQLSIKKQPSTVLITLTAAETGQPPDEVRLPFIGVSGEVAPLVRDDERPLERQKISGDKRLKKIWIGHPVNRRATKIDVEQRVLGPAGQGRSQDAQLALHAAERAGKLRIKRPRVILPTVVDIDKEGPVRRLV